MALPAIIPVIDLMGGRVVRAVAGRRSDYRPVQSVLTDSTEPGAVARALVAATRSPWVYLADLDAIMHRRPDWPGVRAVAAAGAGVLLDGGFRTSEEVDLNSAGIRYVVATETATAEGLRRFPLKHCLLSIDLVDGRVVGGGAWGDDPVEVFHRAVRLGAWQILFLDLRRVGTGCGAGTEETIAACRKAQPKVLIGAGGGVRTLEDVTRLGDAGANLVLVASALHDGTLTVPRLTY